MSTRVHSAQRVWDLPTRLGHWLMALLVAASWWTAENHQMEFHRYSGYLLLGLLVFRLYWGVAGSSTARFAAFVRGPRTTWDYIRSPAAGEPAGHNPLGAWSIVALLTLLSVMIGLGLFAVDVDGIESGPLSAHVSFETGRACAHWHHRVFNALLALIGLHLAAVLYHWIWRGRNLIAAMIHGRAPLAQGSAVEHAGAVRLIVGVVLAAVVVWCVV
ncbi:MAG: CybP [Hydrocarboniphaga sp.]|uniref:cytochrome b/b6 domain-containing protein n=1 Tax=Hydrocarboniphaga sp. TaxID=2033016 RepID=UPI00263A3C22|nr:cytochrome b/b6 domain-containing protein [Hydrocarboniphaga sp.]MDB5972212.1 CybP [Hydrocarboniphaga sp.]